MSTKTEPSGSIDRFLAKPLRVGQADVIGALAVFPVFGPDPHQAYTSFAQGQSQGVKVGELESGASVNNLVVENPTEMAVLLYEGEEVLGAQQNRTWDISALVPAGAKQRIPVRCVEAGRLDGRRHRESFRAAPQAAYPELRREKARQLRTSVERGMAARAEQSAVWSGLAAKSSLMGVRSATGAMHDIYEDRRSELREIEERVRLHDDQLGALVAIAGSLVVLDYVSRADVFGALHGPLVQGYALDALEAEDADPPSADTVSGFALLITDCEPNHRERGIGLGEQIRFAQNGVAGSALVHNDELIQLSAFPEDAGDAPTTPPDVQAGRVQRPSRRR